VSTSRLSWLRLQLKTQETKASAISSLACCALFRSWKWARVASSMLSKKTSRTHCTQLSRGCMNSLETLRHARRITSHCSGAWNLFSFRKNNFHKSSSMASLKGLQCCKCICNLVINRVCSSWSSSWWTSTPQQGLQCSKLKMIRLEVVSRSRPAQLCTKVTSTILSCRMLAQPTSSSRWCSQSSNNKTSWKSSNPTATTARKKSEWPT